MRSLLFLFVALSLLLLLGCGQSKSSGNPPRSQDVVSLSQELRKPKVANNALPASLQKDEEEKQELGTKIIYRGEVTLETEDAITAKNKIEASVKAVNGYVTESRVEGKKNSERSASLTVRIPSTKFDELIQDVSAFGEPISVSRSSEDVTMEYYDVEARLKSKKIQEQRLQDLLKSSTGKLTEILAVEKELLRIREDIESVEGRLRYLKNQVDYSTVSFSIREVKYSSPEGNPGFVTNAKRAFNNSLARLSMRANGFAIWCIAISPYLLILGLIIALVWISSARRKKKFQAEISKL